MPPTTSGRGTAWPRSASSRADIEYARMACELALAGKKLVAASAGPSRPGGSWSTRPRPRSRRRGRKWSRACARPRSSRPARRKLERVDPPAARGLYRKSLEIAADLPEAVAGLSRCPPDAPAGLEVQPLGDRIRLSWTPPAPGWPGAADLRRLAEARRSAASTPATGRESPRSPRASSRIVASRPGETVSYAVLGKRGEAESLAAVAAGPVLYPARRSGCPGRAAGRRGRTVVDPAPRGVRGPRRPQARALRRPTPATATGSGRRWTRPSTPTCSDDQVYHYGIYAIYRTPDGQRFPSPGSCGRGDPAFALSPLMPPADAHPGRTGRGSTGPSRRGARSGSSARSGRWPIPWEPSSRPTRPRSWKGNGSRLVGPGSRPGCRSAAVWLLLLHSAPGAGRNSDCRATAPLLSRLADPTDLRATRLGGTGDDRSTGVRIQLRWRWPREAAATRIVARQGSPPVGPADPEAIVSSVTRDEYDRAGSWVINLPERAFWNSSELELPLDPADSASLPSGPLARPRL